MNIEEIITKMTLEEKIALCIGADFWCTKAYEQYGVPAIMVSDGPHGLRKQGENGDMLGVNESIPATSFPTSAATAQSWDTELAAEIGRAISREAAAGKVAVVLGPGANLKRNPLCGRNFEYYSEDPYLSGKLAASFIKAAQENGIGTSLKHFACNSQEYKRFSSDSILDERTLREMYLTAFEIAVKEGKPKTVMSSYNKINGIHSSENKMLLSDILRGEWGFDGLVMTDWGGMNNRIAGFAAGCDLVMPGGSEYMEKECAQAVQDGTLSEDDINACAWRVLSLVFEAQKVLKKDSTCDKEAHHILARRAAEESAVLLKNEDAILPLAEETKVCYIGHMAENMRYQGAGSSHINPTRLVSPCAARPDIPYVAGVLEDGATNDALLDEAAKLAALCDVPVVFAGLPPQYESEGFDRQDMQMPQGHIRLIEKVVDANPNTVVVLLCGCPVEMPWADKVKAVLYMALPGQAGGEAVANLLWGKNNPSGKLAESWIYKYEDCPSAGFYSGGQKDGQYREGIYVGYRYYQKAKKAVRYPFGFGLSYTSFAYSKLEVNGNEITVAITNTGTLAGAEVAQLYIAAPQNGIHRPLRELKGFAKVFLKPGESKTVTFMLNDRSFAIWADGGWKVPAGDYTVEVGGSSEDLPLKALITKQGENVTVPARQSKSWYEAPNGAPTQQDWETMLGQKYHAPVLKKGKFTMDNTVLEMKDFSFVMKMMYKGVEKNVLSMMGRKADKNDPEFRMLIASSADCALSGMQICGGIKGHLFEGLLAMANGHFFKGLGLMMKK